MMRILVILALLALANALPAHAGQNIEDALFTNKDMLTAKLNPEGKLAVSVHVEDDNQIIKLRRVSDIHAPFPLSIGDWVEGDFHITQLSWVDNKHIAIQLNEIRNGIEDLADSKRVKRLIIVRTPDSPQQKPKVFSVRTKGWLVSPLQDQEGIFLFAKSGIYSKVYKIDVSKLSEHGKKLSKLERVDGGQFKKSNEQAKVDGYATRWFVDAEGKIASVLHFKAKDEIALTAFQDDAKDSVVASWKKDEESGIFKGKDGFSLFPVAMGQSNKEYFCLDLEEENERSVYKVDFGLDTQELVHKSDAYKVVSIEVSDDRSEIAATRVLNNGKIEYEFLVRDHAQKNVLTAPENAYSAVISKNDEGDVSVLYAESYSNPGQFYLSGAADKLQLLGSHYAGLQDENLTTQHIASVQINGLDIPYIVNLPAQAAQAVPLVVMPHGGPIGLHDSVYFDKTTQYLNAKGYAVLRVNFRGSSGYTEALEEGGTKAFTNLMLEDIYAATRETLKGFSQIDGNRVCTYGASYGGYAALMLAIDYPEQFNCAASWAGVTDVALYLNSTNLSRRQVSWTTEHIAHAEKDYPQLTARSPAFNADKITIPVLVAHGVNDGIVDIEHAYRMKLQMSGKAGFEWYLDDESGHNFASHDKQRAFYERLVDFLASNI